LAAVRKTVALELNVLALYKGEEKYLFVYDEESRAHLLDAFRHQAADPRLSLNWFDAAVLAQKLREQAGDLTDDAQRTKDEASRRAKGP
jgi:hypothetical protein